MCYSPWPGQTGPVFSASSVVRPVTSQPRWFDQTGLRCSCHYRPPVVQGASHCTCTYSNNAHVWHPQHGHPTHLPLLSWLPRPASAGMPTAVPQQHAVEYVLHICSHKLPSPSPAGVADLHFLFSLISAFFPSLLLSSYPPLASFFLLPGCRPL